MSRAARRIGVEENADFETRRMIILREAARAYTTHGPDGISMNDLARRLNVTKPALYHYLNGKDQIMSACVAQAEARLGAIFMDIERGTTGLARLEMLIRSFPALIADDFGRFMILFNLNTLKPESRDLHREFQAGFRRRMENIIQQCIDEGDVDPSYGEALGFAVVGALYSLARAYVADPNAALRETAATLFAMLVHGAKRRAA